MESLVSFTEDESEIHKKLDECSTKLTIMTIG
jgi:hypothetical protein